MMLDTAEPSEMEVSGTMSDSDNEYDDIDGHIKDDDDDKMADQNPAPDGVDANGEPKKKYDPKDPLRPRRKKARRACFACQRAHLTCGKPCVLLLHHLRTQDSLFRCWTSSLRSYGALHPLPIGGHPY